MSSSSDCNVKFLRHMLAVVAYRAGNALRGSDEAYANYQGGGKTPSAILAHIGDLFDWALSICRGREQWRDAEPLPWAAEQQRFYASLASLDAFLAQADALAVDPLRLLQGPFADALTHVGQLAMLRRMAGQKIYGENFFVADIEAGRVGPEQAPPRRSF